MNTLFVNTFDIEGGAARAAYRLYQGMRQNGMEARMLVQSKATADAHVLGPEGAKGKTIAKLRPHIEKLRLKRYPNKQKTPWSSALLGGRVADRIRTLNPDVVHLHWVTESFIPITALAKLRRPIFWTLHDMWAFTGGCHYADHCDKFQTGCGACPQLGSSRAKDLSYANWKKKMQAWESIDLTVVTPSRWMKTCAEQSALFRHRRIEVIPNGIDTSVYRPHDKTAARQLLGLDPNKKYILFGAMSATSDKRKGFHCLQPALKLLAERLGEGDVEIIVFGSSGQGQTESLGFPIHYLGRLNDDLSLSVVYAAADLFVAPSLQENLPNTVMEALACGTPSVAFNIGGLPDMIDHRQTGYLVQAFDIPDLAAGMEWVLTQSDEQTRLIRERARSKVLEEYRLDKVAYRYADLYREALLASGVSVPSERQRIHVPV